MKFTTVLFILVVFIAIASGKKHKPNDEERGKSLKKAMKECQKNDDTHIEGAVLKKIKKHKQVTIPANYGDHKLCVLKGVGYMNADNTINEEAIKKKVSKKARADQNVDSIMAECKASQSTPQESAIHIESCLKSHGIDL